MSTYSELTTHTDIFRDKLAVEHSFFAAHAKAAVRRWLPGLDGYQG